MLGCWGIDMVSLSSMNFHHNRSGANADSQGCGGLVESFWRRRLA
jgi:hypothetical protein